MWEGLERFAARVRPHRRMLVVVTATLAVAMFFVAPEYAQLQSSADADAFRENVGDDAGRYVAAAVLDLAFALAYGIGAFAIAVQRRVALAGAVVLALGALFDEIENGFVLSNLSSRETVGDGPIDVMTTLGVAKYSAAIVGLLLLAGAYLAARRSTPDDR